MFWRIRIEHDESPPIREGAVEDTDSFEQPRSHRAHSRVAEQTLGFGVAKDHSLAPGGAGDGACFARWGEGGGWVLPQVRLAQID
jgi:hypothetical protein